MAGINERIVLQDEASKTLQNVAKEANKTASTFDKLKSKMTLNSPSANVNGGFKDLGSKFDGLKNKFGEVFPSFSKSLGGVGGIIGDIAKINPAITAGVAAIAGYTAAMKGYFALTNEYVDAFKGQMEVETKLAQASLNRRGTGNVSDIVGEAGAIQKRGIVGDETLLPAATRLMAAGFTKEAKTFQSSIADMMVYSKGFDATGADADKAGQALTKALNGQIKGLMEYGVVVDADTKKRFAAMSVAERSVFLQDQLARSIGGTNEAFANTSLGVKKSFENSFGDIKENVGAWATGAIGQIYSVFQKYLPFMERVGDVFGRGLAVVGNVLASLTDVIFSVGEALWNWMGAVLTQIQSYFSEIGKVLGLGDDLTSQFSYVIRVIGINISYFAKLIGGIGTVVGDGLGAIIDSIMIAYYEAIDAIGNILPKSISSKFDIFKDASSNAAELYARMNEKDNKSIVDELSTGFDNYIDEVLKAKETAGMKEAFNPLEDQQKETNKLLGNIDKNVAKLGEADEEYLQNVRDYFINRNTWNTSNSQTDARTYNIRMAGRSAGSDDITNMVDDIVGAY